MSPKGAAILVDPEPSGHIVYPYTDEAQMTEAVCLFTSAGLLRDEAILLVISKNHLEPIRRRLEEEGLDLNALESAGQLVWQDAHDLISSFLLDGIVDEHIFKTKIGALITRSKNGRAGNHRRVRVFGEMVDLMWQDHLRATERLEELWNEVIQAHSVPLLCAYSLTGVKPADLPQSLLDCHSHAVA